MEKDVSQAHTYLHAICVSIGAFLTLLAVAAGQDEAFRARAAIKVATGGDLRSDDFLRVNIRRRRWR